jgi:RNase P/RNase MRP subunit p29
MLCKVLKLTNGDTLIGNVVEESRGFIEVHRPMRVVVVPKNNHTFSLSFTKWDPLMNFSIPTRIFKQSIVSVSEATTEIIKVYGEAYTEFDSEFDPDNTIFDDEDESENRMSEIKEEIDRLRASVSSSNNHILH